MLKCFFCIVFFYMYSFCFAQNDLKKIADAEALGYNFPLQKTNTFNKFHILHILATIKSDPRVNFIDANFRYTLRHKKNNSTIEFQLKNNIGIDSIKLNSEPVNFTRRIDTLSILINPNSTLNDLDTLDIDASNDKHKNCR